MKIENKYNREFDQRCWVFRTSFLWLNNSAIKFPSSFWFWWDSQENFKCKCFCISFWWVRGYIGWNVFHPLWLELCKLSLGSFPWGNLTFELYFHWEFRVLKVYSLILSFYSYRHCKMLLFHASLWVQIFCKIEFWTSFIVAYNIDRQDYLE